MLGANLMCGEDALRLRAIGIIGYGKSGFGVTAAQKHELLYHSVSWVRESTAA